MINSIEMSRWLLWGRRASANSGASKSHMCKKAASAGQHGHVEQDRGEDGRLK